MQQDEQLTQWAGEQFLLQNKRAAAAAQNRRDYLALQAACNNYMDAASPEWCESTKAIVQRCHEGKRDLVQMDARIAQLKEYTGL